MNNCAFYCYSAFRIGLSVMFPRADCCIVTRPRPAPAASQSANEPAPAIVEYAPPPAEYARAKAYSNAKYRHIFIGAFYGFLILLVILRWRVAPAFRDLAERASPRRFVQLIILLLSPCSSSPC